MGADWPGDSSTSQIRCLPHSQYNRKTGDFGFRADPVSIAFPFLLPCKMAVTIQSSILPMSMTGSVSFRSCQTDVAERFPSKYTYQNTGEPTLAQRFGPGLCGGPDSSAPSDSESSAPGGQALAPNSAYSITLRLLIFSRVVRCWLAAGRR